MADTAAQVRANVPARLVTEVKAHIVPHCATHRSLRAYSIRVAPPPGVTIDRAQSKPSMPKTVRVPEAFAPLFDQAEEYVEDYFSRLTKDPGKGTIHVEGERYLLVRAASLTRGFPELMGDVLGPETAMRFWYRVARVIGREDARAFSQARNLADGPARLSTGPVHFAYTGWARVEIDDRSRPAPDDSYYLEYTHPNTFESETWQKSGKLAEAPVCVFSAGYSAGWCSESFGVEVHAREVTCVAAGGRECRFVMCPSDKLTHYANEVIARLYAERVRPPG